jgi:DNA-binding transcriptional LysR family regulator
MGFKQLRYFISVAEKLSFTDAANEHFIAQSAISKQISNLEEQIGVPLFIRNKRSVQLTDAGAQLLTDAKGVIAHYEQAINKAKLAGNGLCGNIKVGFLGHEKTFLPKLINHMTKKFPDINIELIQFTRNALNSALQNGEIDIGFTLSVSIEKIPRISWERISTIPFNVVMNHDHPLANEDKISISSIAQEPMIVIHQEISPDGYEHAVKLFTKHGFTPKIVKKCPNYDTVLLMIEAGIGISILPKTVVNPPSTLRYIELAEDIDNIYLIIAWNKHNQNPLISVFTSEFDVFYRDSSHFSTKQW